MTDNYNQRQHVDVGGAVVIKPRLEKRSRRYEKLKDFQNKLHKIVQDELSTKSTPYNMIPYQCYVYAVVSKIEESLRPNCYRIRIDDETLSGILCRIEVDPANPKVGPKMSIGDIIRIHRLTVQIEYDDENRTRNMVLSTSPHHNYTIFKCYDTGAIRNKTCAATMSFTQDDEDRVRAIGKWGRIKFRVAMIETHRVQKIDVKENIPVPNNIQSNCLGGSSKETVRSDSLEPQVISQPSPPENEPQVISQPSFYCETRNCLVHTHNVILNTNTVESQLPTSSLRPSVRPTRRRRAGQLQTITLCKENEPNPMSAPKHSFDAQNSGTSASSQKDQNDGMSNIKVRRVKASPEKVASFLNSRLKRNKNQMETFNRGREREESHSSKNVRTEKDIPFSQTATLPGSDSDLVYDGKQQQHQRKAAISTIDIEEAPAPNQFSLLDTSNNCRSHSDVAPTVLLPEIHSISNVDENEQEMKNTIPASFPLKTYKFLCSIKDFQPCFDFKDEELRFWLRISPLMDNTQTIKTVRFLPDPDKGESTIDILVKKANAFSETELKAPVKEYVSSGAFVRIQDVILEGEVGSLPTYTIEAHHLIEQIPCSQNLMTDVGSWGLNGANKNADIVEKEMNVSSSAEKELDEVHSNNSSFHTAISNSSSTSLQSFTSFSNSVDNKSGDLTILDAEQTIVTPKYSNTSAGGGRDETNNMELDLSQNSNVHGIEEVELTDNSPQSCNVANYSTLIEEDETDAESSVYPADTPTTNSQQSPSENDESENDYPPKSSTTESSDFEPTETYHSRQLPRPPMRDFKKL